MTRAVIIDPIFGGLEIDSTMKDLEETPEQVSIDRKVMVESWETRYKNLKGAMLLSVSKLPPNMQETFWENFLLPGEL